MSIWTSKEIKVRDKFILWLILMTAALLFFGPVGLILIGITFPLLLIYMLLASIYWAISDRVHGIK